ncbi:glycosyltransferase family 2 protein [Patescibacteria group bacterium]
MLPKISIAMPTLNSIKVLKACLDSITRQDYPKSRVEIIVADGGSTDGTIELAKKYGAKVFHNKLKTAEAGKVVAVKNTTGDFIGLIDSDNVLPTKNWFKQMIKPLLKHPKALGSEPWKYTWRKKDSFITRYSALIGMNDPFVHFLGNYDRFNLLTGKWTEVKREEKDYGKYILAKFNEDGGLPTIGANGAVFRADFLKKNINGDYLFDIDILSSYLQKKKEVTFIKVKNGIIHTFCEADIFKFAKKQRRRVRDFMFHKWLIKDRYYKWYDKDIFGKEPWGMVKFILSCVTVVPLLYQALKGYLKKPDPAWFFHPLACEITLWEYGWGRVLSIFKKQELSRKGWKQ